jgi:hypothetical protein
MIPFSSIIWPPMDKGVPHGPVYFLKRILLMKLKVPGAVNSAHNLNNEEKY